MTEPVLRVGGRLLLIDPDGRVLLIHERLESGGSHWLTPGGGVEAGESPRDAAVRETVEEIGYRATVAQDAAAVLVTRRLWGWSGTTYDQTDHFYLAPASADLPIAPQALTEAERQTLLGHRWWSVAELRATDQRLLPPELADVLEQVLADAATGGG